MLRFHLLAAIVVACAAALPAAADVDSWNDFFTHPDTELVDSGQVELDAGAPVTSASLAAFANPTLRQYGYTGSFWEGYAPASLFFSADDDGEIAVVFWDFRLLPGLTSEQESSEFEDGQDVLLGAFGGDSGRFLLESIVSGDTQDFRLLVEFPDWTHLETGVFWNLVLDEQTSAFQELEVNFESFLQTPEPAGAVGLIMALGLLARRRARHDRAAPASR